MPRHVAFLRGVSPTNARMPELKRAFEEAGFSNVTTILSSGNVAFDARASSGEALARKCEQAMQASLGRSFRTIVRSTAFLEALLEADPFSAWRVPATAKRVVTFLHAAPGGRIAFPIEQDGATIFGVRGTEAFTAYLPSPKGPVFMVLIRRTFGAEVTTRTWDTIKKCARA
ncbi:MAG: DUF1697 domain-containing protein [Candidatus Eisenbacteria bacterium]